MHPASELPAWFAQDAPSRYGSKRLLDLCVASGLTIASGPVMLLIATVLWLTGHRPVIFKQVRYGLRGSRFAIYKFTTVNIKIVQDTYVSTDDPRISRLGRFLRPRHLDELPQLWNVLRGDMSMVGPRPRTVRDTEEYCRQFCDFKQRLAVKPGLTGLAQILINRGGQTLASRRRRLDLDLAYIRHCSLRNDLRILARTVRVVLFPRG